MKAAADKLIDMRTERQLCVENHSKVTHCTGWLDHGTLYMYVCCYIGFHGWIVAPLNASASVHS